MHKEASKGDIERSTNLLHHSRTSLKPAMVVWLTCMVTTVLCLWGAGAAQGDPPDEAQKLKARAEIEAFALAIRYADAADPVLLYDGPIVPDPEGIITGGHE